MRFDTIGNLKEFILNKVSEEQIFAYYLDMSLSDIEESLMSRSFKIKNTKRYEEDASVKFTYSGSKVKMHDFGSRIWCGDVFHIVGIVLYKNCNNPDDFMFILNHIIHNMIDKDITYIPIDKTKIPKKEAIFNIEPVLREPNKFDFDYFKQYHIRKDTILNSNVNFVDKYYLNGELNFYNYTKNDPCFAYFIDNIPLNLWKLYFPLREKNKVKFITNNSIPIEQFRFLKPNENLIITKANKDKLLLKQVITDLNICNTEVTNLSSETTIIFSQELLSFINTRYKRVFTIFDNDTAGKDATNHCAINYNYTSLFSFGVSSMSAKDLTDTSKKEGYPYILDLILTNYKKIYESHN